MKINLKEKICTSFFVHRQATSADDGEEKINRKKRVFTKALLLTIIIILLLMLGGLTSYAVTTTFPEVFMPKLMERMTKTVEVEVPVEVVKVQQQTVEIPVEVPTEPEIITRIRTIDGDTQIIYRNIEVPVDTDGQGGADLPTEPAPQITQQPTDQVSYSGAPVTFTVAAQGENLNYQWYSCNASGYVQPKLIVGADTSTYTLDTLSLFNEMNGSYYFCEVWADDSIAARSEQAQLKLGVTVTVNSTTGGNVTVSNLTPLIGEEVSITGTADSGYKLKSFSYTFGYGDVTVTGTDTSFAVPPMATGVVVNAEFATAYPITLTVNGQGTTSLSSDTGCANDLIRVQAIPNLGYSTSAIRYHNGIEWVNLDTYSGVSFAMPAAATSVEVTYSKLPYNLSASVEKGKGSISLATNIGYIGDVVAVNVTPNVPYTLGKLIYTYFDGSTWIEEDITDSKAFTCQPYTGTVKAYFEPQNPYYMFDTGAAGESGAYCSFKDGEYTNSGGVIQMWGNGSSNGGGGSTVETTFNLIDVTDYDTLSINFTTNMWARDSWQPYLELIVLDNRNTTHIYKTYTNTSGVKTFDISGITGLMKLVLRGKSGSTTNDGDAGHHKTWIYDVSLSNTAAQTQTMLLQAAPQLPQAEQTTPVLSYDLNGGITENTQTYTAQELAADTVVTLPDGADLSREGYIFKGWSVVAESTDVLDGYTMPNADVTLYAVWEKVAVVSFDLNGGTTEKTDIYTAQELTADTVVNLPDGADLTREGYIFKGWSVVAQSTDVLDSYTMSNADVTLYAVWEVAPEQENESSSTPIEQEIPPVTSEVLPPPESAAIVPKDENDLSA